MFDPEDEVTGRGVDFLPPAENCGRSRLNEAMKHVARWPEKDRRLFVKAFFTTDTPGEQIAEELGMPFSSFLVERKILLRRFMQASIT